MELHALWQRWRRCALGWGPLFLLFGLSAFDGLVTHGFLSAGWAEELNPLMRRLWARSPLLFGAFKIVTAGAAVAVLRMGRRSSFAAPLLLVALAAYGLLACVHLFWICRAFQVLWRPIALLAWTPMFAGALWATGDRGFKARRRPGRALP